MKFQNCILINFVMDARTDEWMHGLTSRKQYAPSTFSSFQFAYVCKFDDILYSWSIITYKQIYFCMTSRGGANILLPTPVYSRSIHTYVSKCVHMTP